MRSTARSAWRVHRLAESVAVAVVLATASTLHAATAPTVADADGSVHVPEFSVPFSSLASPEAKAAFIAMTKHNAGASQHNPQTVDPSSIDIVALRRSVDDEIGALVTKSKRLYPVLIAPKIIDGVYTETFVPKRGIASENRKRVLINLHGGSFLVGARVQGQAESIPIAALGGIEVISVDYREGPEYKFPAASEDVATVYRALLKEYAPQDIGIYGCSAGGMLAGESVAWLDKLRLPLPGAIGVLCASLGPFSVGDSHYLAAPLTGWFSDVGPEGDFVDTSLYFGAAQRTDPLMYPQNSSDLLSKFPPTLFITGTRSPELSGALMSHIQLIRLGVSAELYVWDGMWHGFFLDPDLPESKDAYDTIVNFFHRHLGTRAIRSRNR
jgi:monoterpene epsilon-lactone hydrolase